MVVTYTEEDKNNAYLFANTNYNIRILQAMYDKRPNLVSKLKIDIRDATQEDYYLPRSLIGRAKVLSVKMTESCCKMLSCNPMRENGPCRDTDEPSWYRVGDSQFDVQCQPACFNVASTKVYDSTNTRTPDTPLLSWHDNTCRIVNSQIQSWEEKPFYRSDTKYETRLNDLPTGFSRIKSDNPFGCGYTYKNNETYCSYYELEYDVDGDSCETSLIEKIVGAVLGTSLLQNLKGGIKAAVNGGDALALPSNVPPIPKQPPTKLKEWQNDIDTNFRIPDVVDYTKDPDAADDTQRAKKRVKRDTTQQEHPRNLLEDKYAAKAKYSDYYAKNVLKLDVEPPDTTAPELSQAQKIWESFFEYVTSAEGAGSLGFDISPFVIKKLKPLLIKMGEKLAASLGRLLAKLPGSFGIRVIQAAIQNVALKIASSAIYRIGAQLAVFLGKMLAAAASVIGWLLMAAFVFDLMFTFWDPFGYNNLFPKTLPPDTMYNGDMVLRQVLGTASADYEWEQMIKLLLSEDEIFSIGLESMLDQLLYLDALIVNSEGSVIDKGDQVSFNGISASQLQEGSDAQKVKQNYFTAEKFHAYNETFYKRAKLNGLLRKIGFGLLGVGGVFLVSEMKILAFLCLLFAIAILCFGSMLSLSNNDIIQFVYDSPVPIVDSSDI